MNRGIYSVVNGMLASQQALDTVSNNLSNTNTSGFKADQVLFNEQLERQLSTADNINVGTLGSGPTVKTQYTNFTQGSLSNTSNPLDFAIEGDGMFAVQGTGGQVQYTRAGAFAQDATGTLITKDGRKVLGRDLQPIQLKPGEISVSASGQISSGDGTPAYASIGIFLGGFNKGSDGFFQTNAPTPIATNNSSTLLKQGSLETSNVNPITSMTEMISLQRSFDMAQKSIWTEDDMTQKLSTILSN